MDSWRCDMGAFVVRRADAWWISLGKHWDFQWPRRGTHRLNSDAYCVGYPTAAGIITRLTFQTESRTVAAAGIPAY